MFGEHFFYMCLGARHAFCQPPKDVLGPKSFHMFNIFSGSKSLDNLRSLVATKKKFVPGQGCASPRPLGLLNTCICYCINCCWLGNWSNKIILEGYIMVPTATVLKAPLIATLLNLFCSREQHYRCDCQGWAPWIPLSSFFSPSPPPPPPP